jgi:hypothetical protein
VEIRHRECGILNWQPESSVSLSTGEAAPSVDCALLPSQIPVGQALPSSAMEPIPAPVDHSSISQLGHCSALSGMQTI